MRAHIDECADCRRLIADVGVLGKSGPVESDGAALTRHAQPEHILGPGAVISGKYQVLHVLGTGGMGKVLAARHLDLGQTVAIKVMHPELAADADSVKRFMREGRAAALLKSENAVRIHDVGRLPSGLPYLVMEQLEGEDLDHLRTRRTLMVPEVVDFMLQAINAIAEAHDSGLVHRDIKPQNLFLAKTSDSAARVKVLDFGLAKELEAISTGSALTAEHMILGSPHFMSPEQIRSPNNVDARADVWAIGATMYQLLTGDPPYTAMNVHGLLARILADPAPRIREVREDVPVAIEEIIVRCMEKDLRKRYGSVRELADALRAAVGWTTSPPPAPSTLDEQHRPTERRFSPDAVTRASALAAPITEDDHTLPFDGADAVTITSPLATLPSPHTGGGSITAISPVMPRTKAPSPPGVATTQPLATRDPATTSPIIANTVPMPTLPKQLEEADTVLGSPPGGARAATVTPVQQKALQKRVARRWLVAFVLVTGAAALVVALVVRASRNARVEAGAGASAGASASASASAGASAGASASASASAIEGADAGAGGEGAVSTAGSAHPVATATVKRPGRPGATGSATPATAPKASSPYDWGK